MSAATSTLVPSRSSLETPPPCHRRSHDLAVERSVAEGVLAGSIVGLVATVLAFVLFNRSIGPVAVPAGIALFVMAYLRPLRDGHRRRPRS